MLRESNKSFFMAEANKNRDQWKKADGESDGLVNGYDKKTDSLNLNMYATGKFDDVIQYQQPDWIWKKKGYLNAEGEGESENEEFTDYEGEASEFQEESFEQEELPKFRQLVRNKKLEMKAQYGKAHFTQTNVYKRGCLGGLVDIKGDGKGPIWKSDINCSNVLDPIASAPKWHWGWRKKWREFKQSGGLAQLKMQSKGMAPIPGYNSPPSTNTNPSPSPNQTGNNVTVQNTDPKIDFDGATTGKAGFGNIIGIVLIAGLVFGSVKFIK